MHKLDNKDTNPGRDDVSPSVDKKEKGNETTRSNLRKVDLKRI